MGTTNWADIFAQVGADPDEANRRFLAENKPPVSAPSESRPADLGEPVHTDVFRQFSTIARRQIRLVISDRGYTVFLALLPFLMGCFSLTVRGTSGYGMSDPLGNNPAQPDQILVMLNVGAVFMGTALTIRDLIGERPIFRREQAVGLSTGAYMGAKIVVFSVFAIVQAAIATTISIVGWGKPISNAVLLGDVRFELFVTVAATCVTSALFGMALSALAQSQDQIMPLLVLTIMSQLVFSGGMIWVTDRFVLDQLSWATPADGATRRRRRPLTPTAWYRARPTPKTSTGTTRRAPGCSTWRCSRCCAWPTARSCGGRSGSSAGIDLMNRPAQPVLTVRAPQSEGSFAPGRDVVVGSDVRADLRVAHPLIARAHLLLRFDQGRWMAIDNNSLNGMFVGGRRLPMVDIHDGQTINIGKPEGPQVTFEVGHHPGTVGQLPPTQTAPMDARPAPPRPQPPHPGQLRRPPSPRRAFVGAFIKTRCRMWSAPPPFPSSATLCRRFRPGS